MKITIEKYGKVIRLLSTDKIHIKINCPVCGHENYIHFDPFKPHRFCDGYEIATRNGLKSCMVEFDIEK